MRIRLAATAFLTSLGIMGAGVVMAPAASAHSTTWCGHTKYVGAVYRLDYWGSVTIPTPYGTDHRHTVRATNLWTGARHYDEVGC